MGNIPSARCTRHGQGYGTADLEEQIEGGGSGVCHAFRRRGEILWEHRLRSSWTTGIPRGDRLIHPLGSGRLSGVRYGRGEGLWSWGIPGEASGNYRSTRVIRDVEVFMAFLLDFLITLGAAVVILLVLRLPVFPRDAGDVRRDRAAGLRRERPSAETGT